MFKRKNDYIREGTLEYIDSKIQIIKNKIKTIEAQSGVTKAEKDELASKRAIAMSSLDSYQRARTEYL
jgi:hypothetical protein